MIEVERGAKVGRFSPTASFFAFCLSATLFLAALVCTSAEAAPKVDDSYFHNPATNGVYIDMAKVYSTLANDFGVQFVDYHSSIDQLRYLIKLHRPPFPSDAVFQDQQVEPNEIVCRRNDGQLTLVHFRVYFATVQQDAECENGGRCPTPNKFRRSATDLRSELGAACESSPALLRGVDMLSDAARQAVASQLAQEKGAELAMQQRNQAIRKQEAERRADYEQREREKEARRTASEQDLLAGKRSIQSCRDAELMMVKDNKVLGYPLALQQAKPDGEFHSARGNASILPNGDVLILTPTGMVILRPSTKTTAFSKPSQVMQACGVGKYIENTFVTLTSGRYRAAVLDAAYLEFVDFVGGVK